MCVLWKRIERDGLFWEGLLILVDRMVWFRKSIKVRGSAMELSLDKVLEARERIKNVIKKTPLIYSDTFSVKCGCQLYLKCENMQKTGAFKIRGAFNKISSLSESDREKGVIASSAGNHAQGVAYAATSFGVKSTIVMPVNAPFSKAIATINYGADVVQYGDVYDEAYKKAVEIQNETGALFIHPFDDVEVMAGQGTIALEILEDLPDTDVIVVPIGGGGLIAGIAVVAKTIKPEIKIIGVQPIMIASMKKSFDKGVITTVNGFKSIADGVSVKTPGTLTFEYVKKYVDEIVTVSEDEIASAMVILLERGKQLSEGAGACPIAALLSGKLNFSGKKVVAVLSGGNVDIATVTKIIDKQSSLSKKKLNFVVNLSKNDVELSTLFSSIISFGANITKINQDGKAIAVEVELQSNEETLELLKGLKSMKFDFKLI